MTSERGFSLVELMISTAIMLVAMAGIAGLLVQNSQVARGEQMSAQVQASARSCLGMIVQVVRSAGWDPTNDGFPALTLDAAPTTTSNFIEVFADLNEDGDKDDADEAVLIRWNGTRIEWRKSSTGPFVILADFIDNDADGDGTPETMFVPNSMTAPTSVTIRITARSPVVDPQTGNFIRYTVSSEVTLRDAI